MSGRGDPCRYCGIPMVGRRPSHYRSPTKDHVLPRSRGGAAGLVVICCLACNQDKGNLSLREWYLHLRAVADPRADRVWDVLVEVDQATEDLRRIAADYRGRPMPEEVIMAAQGDHGGFDRATLEAWGVPWPPPRGWKKQLRKFGVPFVSKEKEAAAE